MSEDEQDPRPAGIRGDDTARTARGGGPPDDTGSSAQARGGASGVSGTPAAGAGPDPTGAAGTGEDDPAGAGVSDTGESAGAMNAKKEDKGRKEKSGSFWKELPLLIAIALVLAFVIKTWVVQAFYIPSTSMENTLLVGDRVLVNKVIYQLRDIKRGEVVVFDGGGSWDEENTVAPAEPTNPVSRLFSWVGQQFGVQPTGKEYIKRVIGVPGDEVACCDAENRVTVNGQPLDEPYLYPGSQSTHTEFGPVTVPEGRLWVMGDHREISYDSRLHQNDPGGGTIPVDSVVGRAFVSVWPLDRMTTHPVPETFERLEQQGQEAAGAPGTPATPGPAPLAAATVVAVPLHLTGRHLWRRRRTHAGNYAE